MRRTALILGAACATMLAYTNAGSAQLAIGIKAGTTGVGGDLSYGIMSRIGLRGSATFFPVKPSGEFDELKYEVELPSPMFTVGADLYLIKSIRVFGGLLIGADEVVMNGDYSGSVEVGPQTYTGSGTIVAAVETKSTAPFLGLGFGRTFGSGVGVFFDLGAAFLGESTVVIRDITGPAAQSTQAQRDQEIAKIQDDVDKYAKIYPMISLGLRIGLGKKNSQ